VPDTVAAVVLAAGLSTRFGGDKLLHPYAGKPLAAHIADTLAGVPIAHRIAIVPPAPSPRRELFGERGFELITNAEPARGMASSLALAAQRAFELEADALLVCLADMPNVTATHLGMLIAALGAGDAAATVVDSTRSPPSVFASRLFPALLTLTGDHGARALLSSATLVEAPPELLRDFDAPADFDQP
jgi:molybdenum cofactor cytidylyltransferase